MKGRGAYHGFLGFCLRISRLLRRWCTTISRDERSLTRPCHLPYLIPEAPAAVPDETNAVVPCGDVRSRIGSHVI